MKFNLKYYWRYFCGFKPDEMCLKIDFASLKYHTMLSPTVILTIKFINSFRTD